MKKVALQFTLIISCVVGACAQSNKDWLNKDAELYFERWEVQNYSPLPNVKINLPDGSVILNGSNQRKKPVYRLKLPTDKPFTYEIYEFFGEIFGGTVKFQIYQVIDGKLVDPIRVCMKPNKYLYTSDKYNYEFFPINGGYVEYDSSVFDTVRDLRDRDDKCFCNRSSLKFTKKAKDAIHEVYVQKRGY